MSKLFRGFLLVTTGAAALIVSDVYAQTGSTPPAAPGAQSDTVEEITVTAQRTEQNLQNVPSAVSAFSAKDLEEKQILSIEDIAAGAPSVNIQPQIGSAAVPQISIRGIQTGSLNPEIDNPIGLYVDGVYLGRSVGAQFDLADLQRIEVLRGPQGTLFGRNAEGGAINFVTAGPTGDFGGSLETSFGDYDLKRVKATVNSPEFNGLSLRMTVLHTERDGYYNNTTPGVTVVLPQPFGAGVSTKTSGGEDTTAFLFAARYTNDKLTIDYKLDYTDEITQSNPETIVGFDSTPNGGFGQLLFQVQPGLGGTNVAGSAYRSSFPNLTQNDEFIIMGNALTVQYQVTDDLLIKDIASYRIDDEKGGLDFKEGNVLYDPPFLGGTPGELLCIICNTARRQQHQTSNELQFIGHEALLDWIAGFFYYDESGFQNNPTYILQGFTPIGQNTYTAGPLTAGDYTSGDLSQANNTAYAAYLHGVIHINDQFDLTGGFRYSIDQRNSTFWPGPYAGANPSTSASKQFQHPDYEFSGTYKFTPDVNAYLRVATGYVSGVVFKTINQTTGVPTPSIFNPTTNTDYELGLKAEFLDHKARLNLAVFEQEEENKQVTTFVPGIGTSLVPGKTWTHGIELEGSIKPMTGLTFNGSLGWDHFAASGPGIASPAQSIRGQFINAPDLNATVSAEYDTPPIFEDTYVSAILDANYTSQYTYSAATNGLIQDLALAYAVSTPEQWLLNARVSLLNILIGSNSASLSVWAKNLTDQRNVQYGDNFGLYLIGTHEAPRTFGATLRYDF